MGHGVLEAHLAAGVSLDHRVDATQVRDDESLETPSVLEDVGQQQLVDVVRHAVDGIVRGHDRLGPALDDAVAKVRQPILVQHPLADRGRELLPVLFDVVDGVVLERRDQLEVAGVVALKALDEGHADAAGQVGVLAVALVDAAPVGVAADVDYGSAIDQALLLALEIRVLMPAVVDGPGLVADDSGDLMDQRGVPRGGQGN